MTISAISPVSFKSSEIQNVQKQKGGATKAVASTFVPGLGQFIDGRKKEGLLFLSSFAIMAKACAVSGNKFFENALFNDFINDKKDFSKNTKLNAAIFLFGAVSTAAIQALNIIDAYKGGKDNKLDKQA